MMIWHHLLPSWYSALMVARKKQLISFLSRELCFLVEQTFTNLPGCKDHGQDLLVKMPTSQSLAKALSQSFFFLFCSCFNCAQEMVDHHHHLFLWKNLGADRLFSGPLLYRYLHTVRALRTVQCSPDPESSQCCDYMCMLCRQRAFPLLIPVVLLLMLRTIVQVS